MTSINAVIYYRIRGRRNWLIKENQQTNSRPTDSNFPLAAVKRRESEATICSRTNTPMLSMQKETKAANQLALLVVIFLICWGPYTVSTVWLSFCDDCINTSLYEFFNWVLWIKSAVNPLLYAFNRKQFRNNCRRMMTGTYGQEVQHAR